MTEQEYEKALCRIEELMELDPDFGTKEGDEFEELVDRVMAYENIHYPIEEPTEEGVEKFRQEQEQYLSTVKKKLIQ